MESEDRKELTPEEEKAKLIEELNALKKEKEQKELDDLKKEIESLKSELSKSKQETVEKQEVIKTLMINSGFNENKEEKKTLEGLAGEIVKLISRWGI